MTVIEEPPDVVAVGRRFGVCALLVAAALAFLLPFGTVSCDEKSVSFTGLELATRHIEPDPTEHNDPDGGLAAKVEGDAGTFALMALVFALFGAGSAAWRSRGGGFATASALSLLYLLLDAELSMVQIDIGAGYALALLCVLTAGILRFRSRRRVGRARRRLAPQAPRPPLSRRLLIHVPTAVLGVSAVAAIMALDALASAHG